MNAFRNGEKDEGSWSLISLSLSLSLSVSAYIIPILMRHSNIKKIYCLEMQTNFHIARSFNRDDDDDDDCDI